MTVCYEFMYGQAKVRMSDGNMLKATDDDIKSVRSSLNREFQCTFKVNAGKQTLVKVVAKGNTDSEIYLRPGFRG